MHTRFLYRAVGIAAVSLLALGTSSGATAVPAAPAAQHAAATTYANQPQAQESWRDLLDRATDKLHRKYPHALLVAAYGYAPGGPTADMSKVTDWIFIYDIPEKHQQQGVQGVFIKGKRGGSLGEPEAGRGGWMGATVVEGPMLDPEGAYGRIVDTEGADHPFQYVALENDLNPENGQRWIFGNKGQGCDMYAVDDDIRGKVENLCPVT